MGVIEKLIESYGLGAFGYLLAGWFIWRNFKIADQFREAREKTHDQLLDVIVANTHSLDQLYNLWTRK